MNIVLLHYNNYFNRRIKKLDTLAEYNSADSSAYQCNSINFNPNDGINTSVVLGFGVNPSHLFDNGCDYDYAVVYDNSAVIKSR